MGDLLGEAFLLYIGDDWIECEKEGDDPGIGLGPDTPGVGVLNGGLLKWPAVSACCKGDELKYAGRSAESFLELRAGYGDTSGLDERTCWGRSLGPLRRGLEGVCTASEQEGCAGGDMPWMCWSTTCCGGREGSGGPCTNVLRSLLSSSSDSTGSHCIALRGYGAWDCGYGGPLWRLMKALRITSKSRKQERER